MSEEITNLLSCATCKCNLPTSDFTKCEDYPRGYLYSCKKCRNIKKKEWKNKFKEAGLLIPISEASKVKEDARKKKWAKENYIKNKDKILLYSKNYRENNKAKRREQRALRRAREKRALSSWANKKYISLWYKMAADAEKETGIKMHVDHIIPLVHDKVCGLHNEDNLQILTASENCSKNNFWISDWDK